MTPPLIHNPIAPNYEIGKVISGAIGAFILFASLFAFVSLMIGGINWITSSGDKAKIETARNRIINSLIGLIIVASIWAVVTLIFPVFGLSFPGFKVPFIGRGLEGIK